MNIRGFMLKFFLKSQLKTSKRKLSNINKTYINIKYQISNIYYNITNPTQCKLKKKIHDVNPIKDN